VRALERLPDRDPDGFVPQLEPTVVAAVTEREFAVGLVPAAACYAVWRVLQISRNALGLVAALVVLSTLAEGLR
jgi:hypothetical protein